MKKLIIISDLWGGTNPTYLKQYRFHLAQHYKVKYYDACALAMINKSDLTANSIHQQFINGGIELVVEKLLKLEKETVNILGLSIGGTIGWKAIEKGIKCEYFLGISATRLRYTQIKIACPFHLIYGNLDPYKPNQNWFEKIDPSYTVLENQTHDFYKDETHIKLICKKLIDQLA